MKTGGGNEYIWRERWFVHHYGVFESRRKKGRERAEIKMRVNHERELGGKRKQRRTKMGTNQMKDYKV